MRLGKGGVRPGAPAASCLPVAGSCAMLACRPWLPPACCSRPPICLATLQRAAPAGRGGRARAVPSGAGHAAQAVPLPVRCADIARLGRIAQNSLGRCPGCVLRIKRASNHHNLLGAAACLCLLPPPPTPACCPCYPPLLSAPAAHPTCRGVIVGWDAQCRASEDWMQQMGVDRLPGANRLLEDRQGCWRCLFVTWL